MGQETGKIYLFAEFRFDASSGDLTQNGISIRLSKQTADLLTVLLVNAGRLVTRGEIRLALWPDGELVAYEKMINNGISRLRYIFKDDAQSPKFIERVPKRGYRIIAAVSETEAVPQVLSEGGVVAEAYWGTTEVEDLSNQVAEQGNMTADTGLVSVSTLEEIPPTVSPLHPRMRSLIVIGLIGLVGIAGVLGTIAKLRNSNKTVPSQQEITLAVAPFEASGEGGKEIAESFRLDVTDALAQLPQVQVRAAHSIEPLKHDDASLPAYASKLRLDMILFGHVAVNGQSCHLVFELVRGKDAAHIATLEYSGTLDELGSIRDKLQQETFKKLQLTGHGSKRPPGSTSDPEAYEAYLQARYHFSEQTPESLKQAVGEYRAALARDPEFAKAYTGLARTYIILVAKKLTPPQESFGFADAALQKALQLDDSSADVHSTLGFLRFYRDWDIAGAEREERRAVSLDPHQPLFHQWLAVLLCDEGRYTEAFHELDLAVDDDPYWPSLYVTESFVAANALDRKRLLAAAHKVEQLTPNSPTANDTLANALWYSGQYREAIAEWRRMAMRENDQARVRLEDDGLKAFLSGGTTAYARVRIRNLNNEKVTMRHPIDFEPAEWYMAAGEKDQAVSVMQKMYEAHEPQLLNIIRSPLYNDLHRMPEFQRLIRQSGLDGVSSDRTGRSP